MSENIDELRSMLVTFRVSELQTLLGYAGRNKSGRKTELQQRALELLRVRSASIHQKIRELYKTIQQNGSLNLLQSSSPTPPENMPQHPANLPRASVNPFTVDTRSHTARQTRSSSAAAVAAASYSQHQNIYPQSYHSTPQYQTAPRGLTPTNIVSANYPVHPDVEFKRLPFYDVISELIKPSTLIPSIGSARIEECNFYFHLTPAQATDIAQSRDVRHPNRGGDYFKQIQMRFCLMETSCKQEDFFPPGIIVKVNNKQCALPNPVPTNKPGVEPKRPPRPVNITSQIKLSPTTTNTIHVQWVHDYGRAYAITVALVHKQASSDLLARLKARGAKHADITRGLIKEKLNEDADNEIATTSLRVSLMCPLGKMRMSSPCRAKTCNHLQCFDASLYLQMNERKPTWTCPVCDKPAVYDDLDIDGYFQAVLDSPDVGTDIKEIQLHKDGSWSVQNEVKAAPVAKPVQKTTAPDDSIEIIDDDEPSYNATSSTESTKTKAKEESEVEQPATPPPLVIGKSVVDLTLSDSEDDEPLAKRRAVMTKPDSTNKFSDTTSISSSSNTSRVSVTPGPSSVSSSGYPISPSGVIALDSPSPPSSPQNLATAGAQPPAPPSCMMPNGSSAATQSPLFSPSMPFLNAESEGNHNNYY